MNRLNVDRRTVLKLAGAAALSGGLTIGTASGQEATTPFEVEGPISNIDPNAGTITAMGTTYRVGPNTVLTSPTGRPLDLNEASTGSLPGRSEPGFIGGTLKGSGEITDLEPLELTLGNAILEPAENVVFGVVTNNGPEFEVNDMAINFIEDVRMRFPGLTDEAGAPLEPSEVPLGTLASAEGYYSTSENALYAFTVELEFVADSGEENENASVTISRGRFRSDKGELRIDGVANVLDGTVDVVGTSDGRVFCSGRPVGAEDGSWRCDEEREEWEGMETPEVVAVLYNSAGTEVARSSPFTPTSE